MATQKAKTVLSWIIAILLAIIAIRVLFYILGAAFLIALTMMKFVLIIVLIAIITLPLYIVIRRKFIK